MPALTQGRFMTIDKIRAGAAAFAGDPNGFIRAYGNRLVRSDASAFTEDQLEALFAGTVPVAPGRVAFGVDVDRSPAGAAIWAVWNDGDRFYGRLLAHRSGSPGWLPHALEGYLSEKPGSPVAMGWGPAITLKSELEDLCARRGSDLVDANQTDTATASLRLIEEVREGNVTLGDYESIAYDALYASRTRLQGDKARFDRAALSDQSPTLALAYAVDVAWQETFRPAIAIY
jgi:hypothetical protein